MTEKIEVSLTFNDFAKNHKSAIELKQLDAKNYKALLTVKAVEDQTKDIGFSDAWKKELADKIAELKPLAEEELKSASENINTYLFNLVKEVIAYHRAVVEMPKDEKIKELSNTIRSIIAAGGGQLEAEFVFNLVKVLYIK
jgi:DNA-directed RNA polymerase subunit F